MNKEDCLDGICTLLNCDYEEAIDEIEKLLLVERWLFSKCKEPQRTDALNYLNKLGYGGEESE